MTLYRHAIEQREPGAQFYEGKLKEKKLTELGHTLITLENTKIIKVHKHFKEVQKAHPPVMNFLIPKRRERIVDELCYIGPGEKIFVKLLRSSRSNKMCVSELGQA